MTWLEKIKRPYALQVAYDVVAHLLDCGYEPDDFAVSHDVYVTVEAVDDIYGIQSASYWSSRYKAARCIAENWTEAVSIVLHSGHTMGLFIEPENADTTARYEILGYACDRVFEWSRDPDKWAEIVEFVKGEWIT